MAPGIIVEQPFLSAGERNASVPLPRGPESPPLTRSGRGVSAFLLVITATLLAILWPLPKAQALPNEVILLRHGEKPLDPRNPDLSKAGFERAQMLASYLTSAPGLTNRGLPSVLFATGWTRHDRSRRPYETLEPLARRLHRPIKRPFLAEQYSALARQILSSHECDGKVVVVCWVHDNLAELAGALGVRPKPPAWKGHSFDRVWVITWPEGRAELKELTEPSLP